MEHFKVRSTKTSSTIKVEDDSGLFGDAVSETGAGVGENTRSSNCSSAPRKYSILVVVYYICTNIQCVIVGVEHERKE